MKQRYRSTKTAAIFFAVINTEIDITQIGIGKNLSKKEVANNSSEKKIYGKTWKAPHSKFIQFRLNVFFSSFPWFRFDGDYN